MTHKKTLTELFLTYSRWTDKETEHGYGMFYDKWLSRLQEVRKVLCLGVSTRGGGDLLAFNEYFPDATIVGVDICERGLVKEVRHRRGIDIVLGDAYRKETVEQIKNRYQTFDLIVDDLRPKHAAFHMPDDQIKAFDHWNSLLHPDGLYIIEDVVDPDGLFHCMTGHHGQWHIGIEDARQRTGLNSDSVLFFLQLGS